MNKKLISKRVIALIAAMSLIGVPLVAKPVMKKITAYLNPTITYMYDGEKVLEDVNSLTYGNKTYVPVSEFAKALGKDVSYKNGKIVIISKEEEKVEEEEVEEAKERIIDKATIKEINKENNQVTILPAGSKDSYENFIILNVGPDTLLRHEKLKIRVILDDLEVGMEVKVAHSLISTFSLPPQTNAFDVMIYGNSGTVTTPDKDKDKDEYEIEDAVIKEINKTEQYLVIVKKDKEYKITFNKKTEVEFEKGNKKANIDSLKVGQVVDVEVEDGVAEEIEIQN